MAARSLSERIVDVLAICAEDPDRWPDDLRAACSVIHSRFEALKLDWGTAEAWRQAKAEWVQRSLREAGLAKIVYHFRDGKSRLT
ncbi:MAG: hypothetical protein JSS02_30375 [Planctomycetes bacterium]|nr:hypothetical protein [Planctomycetota bacterium]